MADIDLFVCISRGTAEYAELMKEISSKLLSDKHNINWKYVLSGSVKNVPDGYEFVGKAKFNKQYVSSYNHGMALNLAAKKITAKYVIMVDTDFVFLIHGWDDIIVKNLDNGYAAFGADTPLEMNRSHNFPFAYCFCYRSDILKDVDLDFRPKLNKSKNNLKFSIVSNDREKEVLGMSMGSKFRWETSSRIPFLFYDNKLKSKSIKCVLGDSGEVKLPFLDKKKKKTYMEYIKKSKASREHMAEWHYEGKLFATHLRGSIHHNIRDDVSQYWIKRINLYLKKLK